MTFSLIITTYNRPTEVLALTKQALQCQPPPGEVIIVDSSDEVHPELPKIQAVRYIRSSHKNQPYQRLLGATAATSDIVVFLDDDLEITNQNIFEVIINEYRDNSIAGVTIGIDYHSSIPENLDSPALSTKNMWTNWFWRFTGVVFPQPGKIGRLGIVGVYPNEKCTVEYFRGPCMSFRRKIIHGIIPKDLLIYSEKKISMGEDKIISLLATKFGKLIRIPFFAFYHPANQSTYFTDVKKFTAKVVYSRLYLSKIYAKVLKKPWCLEIIIFHWFTFWRLIIAVFSWLIRPSKTRMQKLIGILEGWHLALTLPQKAEKLTPGIHWPTEIQKDLERSGIHL